MKKVLLPAILGLGMFVSYSTEAQNTSTTSKTTSTKVVETTSDPVVIDERFDSYQWQEEYKLEPEHRLVRIFYGYIGSKTRANEEDIMLTDESQKGKKIHYLDYFADGILNELVILDVTNNRRYDIMRQPKCNGTYFTLNTWPVQELKTDPYRNGTYAEDSKVGDIFREAEKNYMKLWYRVLEERAKRIELLKLIDSLDSLSAQH